MTKESFIFEANEEAQVRNAIKEDEYYRVSKGIFEVFENVRSVYCKKTLALIGLNYFNDGGTLMQATCTTKLLLR
jgi:hypothetical protein